MQALRSLRFYGTAGLISGNWACAVRQQMEGAYSAPARRLKRYSPRSDMEANGRVERRIYVEGPPGAALSFRFDADEAIYLKYAA